MLNADDEEQNVFYEVVYSNKDSDSDEEDEERIVIRKDRGNESGK